jgi:hypothetical protein
MLDRSGTLVKSGWFSLNERLLMRAFLPWIVLFLFCGILVAAVIRKTHQDTRPDVVPLTVPAYPNARQTTVAPLALTPGVLTGTLTTFVTADAPAVLRDWYATTLERMGWSADAPGSPELARIEFTDRRGCPASHARISWKEPIDDLTAVAVEYSTDACIRWNQRPHDVVPLTVPAYPSANIRSVTPQSRLPNTIVSSRTVFKTSDSPDVIEAWYTATMHAMGWGDVINSTSDQTLLMFSTYRVCPHASAEIDWEDPINGITTVTVDYDVSNCRL